jgi:predicted dehydrogenase
MKNKMTRRELIERGTYAGAAVWLGPTVDPRKYQANEKLNIACIGVYNRAKDNLNAVAHENIVALCDINSTYLEEPAKRFPSAKLFSDFRKVVEMKGIDAFVVATPDHTHAPASILAMETGHHCYCEKPLTHSVYETRLVTETAAKHKRVTQMGTQIHAESNYRRVVELVKAGAVGQIREVHVWCDKSYGGVQRLPEVKPVPKEIDWDLWTGPVKKRPYNPGYLPFQWRNWWDFGGGTLADMGCHHIDLPFWALDLRFPTRVKATGPSLEEESTPQQLMVEYDFAARGELPPVKLTWYHGGKRPAYFAEAKLPKWGDGTLFVGDKGMLLADYGRKVLLPESDYKDYHAPPQSIPESIGHHREWIAACKKGDTTTCNFDYAGPLTEAVLLGNVSYRVGQALDWDPIRLKATNCPEADKFIKPEYHNGWKLGKLP